MVVSFPALTDWAWIFSTQVSISTMRRIAYFIRSVFHAPNVESVVSGGRVKRDAGVFGVHCVCSGFESAAGGRRPEESGEVVEAPVDVPEPGAVEECIETGVSGVFEGISCEPVACVLGEEGVPFGFGRDVPSGGAEALGSRGVVIIHDFVPLVESAEAVAVCGVVTVAVFFVDTVVALSSQSGQELSVIEVFRHPALEVDPDGCVYAVIPWVKQVIPAGEGDRVDDGDDKGIRFGTAVGV